MIAGTATAVSNRVSRRQAGRWAAQDDQAAAQQQYAQPPQEYAAPAPAAAPPVADDMSSKIDQLKELGALKEQGILTEAEFAEQKSRILRA